MWYVREGFILNLYFQPDETSPYMRIHEPYHYEDLENVFAQTDLLIAPSIWYETFGYTVLEALSYGVPVLVSDTVGAKDIIPPGAGIVVQDISVDNLAQTFMQLDAQMLQEMNNAILQGPPPLSMDDMSRMICERCYQKYD